MANNYPVVTDPEDYFRQNEKRLMHQERRPIVRRPSDLLGPGIAAYAVEIAHWDVDDATFNGTFWTQPGDTGAPDLTHWWVGQVQATNDGFGIQQVMTFHDSAFFPPITYRRQFYDPGNGNISYSAWVSQHAIAEADPGLSTVGDSNGAGIAYIKGTGEASIPGLILPRMLRNRSASQSIPDLSETTVRQWNDLVTDGGEWTYNNVTGVFTAGIGGTYLCNAIVKLDAGDADTPYVSRMFWRRGGSGAVATGGTYNWDAGSDTYVDITSTVNMLPGQTLELMILVNNAGGGSITSLGDADSKIQFLRLGA